MIPQILIDQCQQAFDEGFDSVEQTWRQTATVGEPVTDFKTGCQTYGKLAHNPTPQVMRLLGRNAALKLNEVVEQMAMAKAAVSVHFLNGVERPRLDFSEENGVVSVRCYIDFAVRTLRYEFSANGYGVAQ